MSLTEELLKRLDLLAAKLGTTAQYLWGVYVKQAQVEVVCSLITILICLLVCAGVAVALFKLRALPWTDSYGEPTVAGVLRGLLGGSIAAVAFTIIVCTVSGLPTLLLNPEYWALQQIVAALK